MLLVFVGRMDALSWAESEALCAMQVYRRSGSSREEGWEVSPASVCLGKSTGTHVDSR